MNRHLQPRIDSVLPQPHSLCALRDPHTLDPRLSSQSGDLTILNSGHQLTSLERSARHNNRSFPDRHQLNSIQRP